MPRLKPEDLDKIAESMKKVVNLREGEAKAKVTIHMGTCGIAAGARKVMTALITEAKNREDIIITSSGCAGLCSSEPMATVELKGAAPVKYIKLDEEKIKKIFQQHVVNGKIVNEYALAKGSERST